MKRELFLAGATAALTITGTGYLHAQVRGGALDSVIGSTTIDDTIEDIEDDTQDEFERSQDEGRFGTATVPPGFRGSIFASGSYDTEGDEDDYSVQIGGRFTLGQGRLNHTVGIAGLFSESTDEDEDGDDESTDTAQIFALYEATYDISDRFYGFGILSATYDEDDDPEQDYFIGVGPGYRIFSEPDLAWRVQAGPGWRYQEFLDGDDASEFAGIFSSRFFYQVSETVFLTNDTDVLWSDSSVSVTNDFGFNLAVQGPFSLRAGLLTDWEDTDSSDYDNLISAAVVYSFAP
jgi:putative salt-induced outer membrane protein